MKKIIYAICTLGFIFIISCVQKTANQTITFELNVKGIPNIKTVEIRIDNEAIGWEKEMEMKPIIKDSLYSLTLTGKTGYLFTEVKFKINGEYELKELPNRKVIFDKSGTTLFKSTFNKINQNHEKNSNYMQFYIFNFPIKYIHRSTIW